MNILPCRAMSTTDKVCLKWNDFQEDITNAFVSLRDDNDFTDVTLTCEDGQQVETHKVILASSSSFFQNLLKRYKHSHPLIYMRGTKSLDLWAIVDFLYYGEAKIYHENLDTFLNLSEELGLKGLKRENAHGKNEEKQSVHPGNNQQQKPEENKLTPFGNGKIIVPEQYITGDILPAGIMAFVKHERPVDFEELDKKIKSKMIPGENLITYWKQRAWACQVCGKESYSSVIKKHIEANHIDGLSIPCTICNKMFRSRHAMRIHIARHHKE